MKIIHVADSHFKADRLEENVRCFTYIIDQARKIKPDLIVHAGDLFDKNTLMNSSEYRAAVDCMDLLASIAPVIMVRGNHDPVDSMSIFDKINSTHPIICSEEISVRKVNDINFLLIPYINPSLIGSGDKIGDIHITGASSIKEHIEKFADEMPTNKINIIVAHISVYGAEFANSEKIQEGEVLLGVDDFNHPNISGAMLGHIHKSTQSIFEGTRVRYSGAHYRTRFGELSEPGFFVWDFKDIHNPKIGFMPVPARDMHRIEFDEDETRKIIRTGKIPIPVPSDSDVKFVFNVPEGMSSLLKVGSFYSDFPESSTVKIEPRVIPKQVIRSENMGKAITDMDKFREWCLVTEIKPGKSLLGKYNEIVNQGDHG